MPPYSKILRRSFCVAGQKIINMKLYKYTLDDFSGGFSAQMNSDSMDNGYTPNSYNVEALGGTLKTMNGYSKYITTAIIDNETQYYPVRFPVYYAQASQGASQQDTLLVVASTGLKRGLFIYKSQSWQKLQGNITEADMDSINCVSKGKNQLFICNAAEGIYTYDTTSGLGMLEDAPGFAAMALHYERIWGINSANKLNTVYYSAESDYSNWKTTSENADAGKLEVTTFDGDGFVGIANVFDDILLYRRKTLFRITGTSPENYQMKQIPASCGAVGPDAIANNGRYSFYIGNDGIYSYDGIRASIIENNRLRFLFENRINRNKLAISCAVIFDNKLYAAVPADGSAHNNLIIEYDIDSRVFNIRSGMNVSKFVVFNNQLLFSGNDGFIYTFDNSIKYNGANITAHYETPYCDFQNKNMLKTLDSVCFTAKGTGSVKISAETERGTVSKTVTLKRSSDFDIYHIPLYNAGRRFKFCFDNVNGSQFEIIRPEFILEKDDED